MINCPFWSLQKILFHALGLSVFKARKHIPLKFSHSAPWAWDNSQNCVNSSWNLPYGRYAVLIVFYLCYLSAAIYFLQWDFCFQTQTSVLVLVQWNLAKKAQNVLSCSLCCRFFLILQCLAKFFHASEFW